MKITVYLNFLLIALIAIAGCKKAPSKSVAAGKIENGIYSSSFFSLKMKVPEDWTVETMGQVEKTKETLEGNGQKEVLVTNLLVIFSGNPEDEFKPNLAITAEHHSLYPECNSRNAKDYLEQVKQQYEKIESSATGVENYTFANNTKCYSFDVTMELPNIKMSQTHFSVVQNKFYIDVIMTYQTDSQKEELKKIVDSLQFN